MKLKSRVLGLLAATVLTFSAIGMAAAEPSTATFNENPSGACAVQLTGGVGNFGTYQWNVDHYEAAVQPTLDFVVTQSYGPPGTVGCDVRVLATDMTSGPNTISKDHLLLNVGTGIGAQQQVYMGYNLLLINNGSGPYSWTVYLNNLWNNAPAPGIYTGTLTLTAVHDAP